MSGPAAGPASAGPGGPEAPPAVPALEAVHVTKRFGRAVRALDDVSVQIADGEWVAVAGTSGSGKTSLLQLFAALDSPNEGRGEFRGQDLSSMHDMNRYRRNSIGIVFQLHNLLAHLDVRRNIEIAMYGTHRRGHVRRERASELLAEIGLVEQQDRKPPELSGGERQRVAIARALANDPAILLADEPTGSLDPENVGRLLELFHRLNTERGMTIVMVTHDLRVARSADRIVTLASGRLVEGAPDPDRPDGAGRYRSVANSGR